MGMFFQKLSLTPLPLQLGSAEIHSSDERVVFSSTTCKRKIHVDRYKKVIDAVPFHADNEHPTKQLALTVFYIITYIILTDI